MRSLSTEQMSPTRRLLASPSCWPSGWWLMQPCPDSMGMSLCPSVAYIMSAPQLCFCPPKDFVLLASTWGAVVLPHAKFLKTPCNISFLALSAATRYGDLPSEPYPCANLPLLKQKRDGHRMTRCFPLVNWNFVFPDSCWAGLPVSLYTAQMSQACVLPGRSCVPGWKQPQRKTGIDIC